MKEGFWRATTTTTNTLDGFSELLHDAPPRRGLTTHPTTMQGACHPPHDMTEWTDTGSTHSMGSISRFHLLCGAEFLGRVADWKVLRGR